MIISLGVTLIFCALIYFFLRKRIDGVDKKVNLLMQLVKEHHEQVQQQSHIIMREQIPQEVNNLIPVSDDEEFDDEDEEGDNNDEQYDSDDSDEISDTEDDDGGLRSISLSGAETNMSQLNLNSSLEIENLTLDNDEKQINLDEVTLDDFSFMDKDNSADDNLDTGDNANDNNITLEEIGDDDDISKHLNDDDLVEDNDLAEDNDLVENIDTELTDTKTVKTVELNKNNDISKLKVADLKKRAEEMGLQGYKSLKKKELVNFIINNQTKSPEIEA
jgi:hypothetical protein